MPVVALDIDGILLDDTIYAESLGGVIPGSLDVIQSLVDQGHSLLYYTSRPEIDRLRVWQHLDNHGFPNAPLFMGKPQAHIYVDDRSVSSLADLQKVLSR